MSTKNTHYCLLPQYLFTPTVSNPFVYTGWNNQGKIVNLELRPLKSTLYYLRNMIDQTSRLLHNSGVESWCVMFLDKIRQLQAKYYNSSCEVFLLVQILELYMYIFHRPAYEQFLEHPTNVKNIDSLKSTGISISNSNPSISSFPITSSSLSFINQLPTLSVLPLKQCQLYLHELNDILYSVYILDKPLLIPDCPNLILYFNTQPELNQTKSFGQFTLQPKNQQSFAADMLYLNMLCMNLDENQILNLLTQQRPIDVVILIKDLLYCLEKQCSQLKRLCTESASKGDFNKYPVKLAAAKLNTIQLIPRNILTSNNEERASFSNLNQLLS